MHLQFAGLLNALQTSGSPAGPSYYYTFALALDLQVLPFSVGQAAAGILVGP